MIFAYNHLLYDICFFLLYVLFLELEIFIFNFCLCFTNLFLYTVFGWGGFGEDEKHREEKWVENSVFHCLAKDGKH